MQELNGNTSDLLYPHFTIVFNKKRSQNAFYHFDYFRF
jgi:hypothetical protein